MPATSRSERAASTSAPPGICADQGHEAGRGENKADIDLRPFLRGEIDRDEGPEAGLHVGDEEDEPIEAAQAAPRRRERRLGWLRRRSPRRLGRTRPAAAALPITAVAEAA